MIRITFSRRVHNWAQEGMPFPFGGARSCPSERWPVRLRDHLIRKPLLAASESACGWRPCSGSTEGAWSARPGPRFRHRERAVRAAVRGDRHGRLLERGWRSRPHDASCGCALAWPVAAAACARVSRTAVPAPAPGAAFSHVFSLDLGASLRCPFVR